MSHVIELKDAVFNKLVRNAEKDGVTPEVWIENVVEEKTSILNLPKLSDEDRAEMHRYSKSLDKKLGELLREKMKKQGIGLSLDAS